MGAQQQAPVGAQRAGGPAPLLQLLGLRPRCWRRGSRLPWAGSARGGTAWPCRGTWATSGVPAEPEVRASGCCAVLSSACCGLGARVVGQRGRAGGHGDGQGVRQSLRCGCAGCMGAVGCGLSRPGGPAQCPCSSRLRLSLKHMPSCPVGSIFCCLMCSCASCATHPKVMGAACRPAAGGCTRWRRGRMRASAHTRRTPAPALLPQAGIGLAWSVCGKPEPPYFLLGTALYTASIPH